MKRWPSFDLDSTFFFFEGGPVKESISSKVATSSGVNTFALGMVRRRRICSDCFSDKTLNFL